MSEDRLRLREEQRQASLRAPPPPPEMTTLGDLPLRPNYKPEEGRAGFSDIWAVIRAVILGVLVTLSVGWMLGGI